MTIECPICAQNMNKSTRSCVECPSCEYKCCKECIKTYVIGSNSDPICMNCSKPFSKTFLYEVMPRKWMTREYKQHRANVLFEREKVMIPDTMKWVEAECKARKNQEEINKLNSILKEYSKKMKEINQEILTRMDLIRELRNNPKENNQDIFIVKCPECPGFLSKEWKCLACNTRVCKYCREVLIAPKGKCVDDIKIKKPENEKREPGDGSESSTDPTDPKDLTDPMIHICNKEELETSQMIKKDTKPCPKCGNPIHKIDGCDQMFDPQCGTAFSWKTGQIVTGHIHNPHYMEWLRASGQNINRAPGDILCGGTPGQQDIFNVLKWIPNFNEFMRNIRSKTGIYSIGSEDKNVYVECCRDLNNRYFIMNASRIANHIEQISIRQLQNELTSEMTRNMRIQYILKEYGETEYKSSLVAIERQCDRDQEISHVLNTYVQATADILRNFIHNNDNLFSVADMMRFPKFSDDFDLICNHPTLSFEKQEHMFRMAMEYCWWSGHKIDFDINTPIIRYNRREIESRFVYVPNTERVQKVVDELEQIEKYCNEHFEKISKAFKLTTPCISIKDNMVYNHR